MLAGKIDAALFVSALVLAVLFGASSLAEFGETVWWVGFIAGLIWGTAIVGRGGLRELSISERSGVVMPGEMAALLQPQRWLWIREQVTLAVLALVPLSLLAWAIWAVG